MHLLLIEDDPTIAHELALRWGKRDWQVQNATSLAAARNALAQPGLFDLVLLDLGLPDGDGIGLLAELRRSNGRIPVLVLTARDALEHRVRGLQAGADDYLLKPFDLEELIVRVRALLRRAAGNVQVVLAAGNLTLDPARKLVALAGQPVELSAREFAVLETLMQRPGAVLSRKELEDSIYGWGEEVASNAIEVHLHHLRRKIGAQRIRNVRGVGYRLSEEGP